MATAGEYSLLIAETADVYDRCSGVMCKKGLNNVPVWNGAVKSHRRKHDSNNVQVRNSENGILWNCNLLPVVRNREN